MTQQPITVTYTLEEVLGEIKQGIKDINQKLETIQKDVTDLKIGQAELKTRMEGLEKDVKEVKDEIKEIKGSQKAQIWTLIGILSATVTGFLLAVGRNIISYP